MAVTISKGKVKKVCYILGASRERSPRAMKIARVFDADIIDCPSKWNRYSTFPILLPIRLILSKHDVLIVNNIPAHILGSVWFASKFQRFVLVADFVNFWKYAVRKKFRFLSGIASCLENWIYRRVKYALAINELVAESARNVGVRDVQVIRDAADHELFTPSFNSDPILVVAANLRRDEGVDIFLRAMKIVKDQMPTAKCLVAGTGEEDGRLRKLASDLGLNSQINFLGWIPHSELPKVYHDASIGVIPMRPVSPLALPIKLFEYMSSGLAIISTDTPAIKTIVEDGKNGMLFSPGDYNALASLIIKTLLDKNLMARLQKEARKTVENGLNWKSEAEKLNSYIDKILSERDV
jgi:glycosyltransferase involved in cell wall biosynthesis